PEAEIGSTTTILDGAIRNAFLFSWEKRAILDWLTALNKCASVNEQPESVCHCVSDSECDTSTGQTCVSGVCHDSTGRLSECPYIALTGIEIHPCCGDGVRLPDEECDDGNNVSGDGCTWDCRAEASGACCLTDSCVAVGSPSACGAEGGTYFAGQTCEGLDNCGHCDIGACVLPGHVCRSPSTKVQCDRLGGKFTTEEPADCR